MTRTVGMIGVVAVLIGVAACERPGLGLEELAPRYSCSRDAKADLRLIKADLRKAGVDTDSIGVVSDCDSGIARYVAADFAPGGGSGERFLRDHFRCGPTRIVELAVPPRVDAQGTLLNQPSRILECHISGIRAEAVVHDHGDGDGDLAGVTIEPLAP